MLRKIRKSPFPQSPQPFRKHPSNPVRKRWILKLQQSPKDNNFLPKTYHRGNRKVTNQRKICVKAKWNKLWWIKVRQTAPTISMIHVISFKRICWATTSQDIIKTISIRNMMIKVLRKDLLINSSFSLLCNNHAINLQFFNLRALPRPSCNHQHNTWAKHQISRIQIKSNSPAYRPNPSFWTINQ